jgi:hypothetical protein
VLAGLFALFWLVPSFGVIDLTVTWDPEWPQVLEAGWGLYFTLLVGAPFVAVVARPRLPAGAPEMLVVATVALLVSGVVALEIGCVVLGVILAIGTVAVTWLWRWSLGELRRSGTDRMSAVFGILAVAAAGPWLVYSVHMWSLNRQDRFDSDVTNGVDHYSVQGAFGLAMVLLSCLLVPAGMRAGRRLVGVCAGLAAAYLGLVSLAWHPTPGSFGPVWSVLCMAWGLALVVLPVLPTANSGKGPPDTPYAA